MSASSRPIHTRLYGLDVLSEIPMPIHDGKLGGEPVRVRYGRAGFPKGRSAIEGTCFHAAPGITRLTWHHVGSFLVEHGRKIVVEPARDADDESVARFLMGPVFAVLLHQRGFLVLHGSAVDVRGKSIAFLGEAGSGKSTLASAFFRRGHAVLTDDVVALDDKRLLYPGTPGIALEARAASALGFQDGKADDRSKLVLDLGSKTREPVKLKRAYILTRSCFTRIALFEDPQNAFEELLRHSYCAKLLPVSDAGRHVSQCASLVNGRLIRRLYVAYGLDKLENAVRLIEEDAEDGG